MLKKTISYVDFNGEPVNEDMYFNLNKIELMEMSVDPDFANLEDALSDINMSFRVAKEIVLRAYGKKSEDGKRFIKSDELRKEFEQSEAFSEFMFALATDENLANDFFGLLIPNIDVKPKA